MALVDKIKKVFKYDKQVGLCGGGALIAFGMYSLIIGIIHDGVGYILGDIGYILIGISFITAGYLKKKLMFVCTVVAIGLAFGLLIFEPRANIAIKKASVQQGAVEQSPKPNDAPGDTSEEDPSKAYSDLHNEPVIQKMMEVEKSNSFQEQLKKQNPQTPKEYAALLEAHGVTGLSDVDIEKLLADSYNAAAQKYQAENPGKAPEEKDEVMAKRFGEVLKEYGLVAGMNEIVTDLENVIWINARFKGDEAAFNEWWADVVTVYESNDSASADSELPQGEFFDIPSDETTLDIPFAENENVLLDRASTAFGEDSAIPDTDNRGVTPPAVEPEKVVTEVSPQPPALPTEAEFEASLKERFSQDRFDRAMDTLDRYGPEEGLRRLREDDPEVARQVERQRARQDSEESER